MPMRITNHPRRIHFPLHKQSPCLDRTLRADRLAKQKTQRKKVNVTTILFDDEVDIIHDRFPECYARLATIYRKNVTKMVDRFVRCNFGEEDLLSDDVEHDLLHFLNWDNFSNVLVL